MHEEKLLFWGLKLVILPKIQIFKFTGNHNLRENFHGNISI